MGQSLQLSSDARLSFFFFFAELSYPGQRFVLKSAWYAPRCDIKELLGIPEDHLALVTMLLDVENASENEVGFKGMHLSCKELQADIISFNAAIGACYIDGLWPHAQAASQHLCTGCGMCSSSQDLRAAFLHLGLPWQVLLRVLSMLRLQRDVISYSSMVRSGERTGRWEISCSVLQDARSSEVPCDITMQNSIISMQGSGRWKLAQLLLHKGVSSALRADAISVNGLIQAVQRQGYWAQAQILLRSLPEQQLAADVIGYSSAIQACKGMGEWQQAQLLFDELRGQKLKADTMAYSSTMGVLAEIGQWSTAMYLLDELQEARLETDAVACNTVLDACSSQMHQAKRILQELRSRCLANTNSYNALISLTIRAGDWQQSLSLFAEMENAAVQPDGVTYSLMADVHLEASHRVVAVHSLFHVARESQKDLAHLPP